MHTYTCLITDDRYGVPSLVFHGAPDDATLRAIALRELRANSHYLTFEARLDDIPVLRLTRNDLDVAS